MKDNIKKLIRVPGGKKFGTTNLKCKTCKRDIMINGEPVGPVYYKDNNGHHYCNRHGNK